MSVLPLLHLALACTPAPEPAPPAARPDLVLFVVDSLRADHLGLHGHDRPTSPRLDALAAEALAFPRALAHSGWTLASTASLFTSRFPSEHGAFRDPDDARRMYRLDRNLPTLAEALSGAGYTTAAFVNNAYLAPEFGLQRGFAHYDYDGGTADGQDRPAAETVARALQWLDGQDPGPVFLYLHVMEPHVPYLPPVPQRRLFTGPGDPLVPVPFAPPDLLDAAREGTWVPDPEQREYVRKVYDEEVRAADEALGLLLDGLAARGRWDHTLLAFTADHGEEHWDHGGFEHGHTLHGELLRVPLVIRGLRGTDGAPLPAGQPQVTVQLADVMPTLLAAAGAPVPDGLRGMDLRVLVETPPEARPDRPVLSEDCLYGPPRAALTAGDLRVVANLADRSATVWTTDPFGQADVRVADEAEAAARAGPLLAELVRLRGDLARRQGGEATAPLDEALLNRLRALGYLED